jgi:crotonobetaine/carnitine-CoA ligase
VDEVAPELPVLPDDLRGLNVRDFLEEAVREVPDQPFVITYEGATTFAELDDRINRTAAAWQSLGVGKGERIGFIVGNTPDFLVAWLALAKIGAVLVAINTRFKPAEMRAMLEIGKVTLALADAERLQAARAGAGGLRVVPLDDLTARAGVSGPEFDRPPLAADDVVSFIFTSGTTGRSKAVMQTHGNYVLTGQAYPWWLACEPGTRFYCCLPLFHVNGQAYSTMGTIGNRGTLILAERFSASRFWDDVGAYGANVVNYIGAMIAILTKLKRTPAERNHSLRIAYGAPKFPEDQLQAIEARYGLTLVSGFGMSETTFGLVESLETRPPGTIGRPRRHPDPRLGNEVRVVDDADRDVAPGEIGELVIRNAMMMKGYFDQPELTAETLRGGWLHTGDYASMDEDGYFSYVDRKKDIVRRRGENVSSVEVEVTLGDHPAVEEAAIVGVPAELTDEEVLAFVVLRPGHRAEPSELVAFCAERLSDYKVPRFVQIVESFPKTATQKVEKGTLKTEVADPARWYDAEAERQPTP